MGIVGAELFTVWMAFQLPTIFCLYRHFDCFAFFVVKEQRWNNEYCKG